MIDKEFKDTLFNSLRNFKPAYALGDFEALEKYLEEEIRELTLSRSWESLKDKEKQETNPHNVLIWALLGLAPLPSKLEHHWTGGDFPDVDLDFEPDKRDAIKNMLRDKFGERNCMEVSTFGGTHIKGAIQDLARIEGVDPQEVFKVTTTINYNVNNDEENNLEWIVNNNATVRKFLAEHIKVADWVEKMEEVKRSIGKHASAYIIASEPLSENIPVVMGKGKEQLTGYPESSAVKSLQEVGFIKFDLLGLENLTVIRETLEMIIERHGTEIDFDKVDLNDPDVYKLMRKGFNGGVFQIDSPLAAGIINTIKPTSFEDISALNALIRPACLQVKSHHYYRDHKLGRFNRKEFPVWKDLEGKISDFTYGMLDATYGIPIYQEQTMAMLAEFCGVSLDETNKMRKIIGIPAAKKQKEHFDYIETQRLKWMDYGGKKIGEDLAEQWWDTAVGSLSYGFNRSHSISYAMIAFRQLYLKAKYPAEFYAALLRTTVAESGNLGRSKLMKFTIEAKNLGVDVESPHINESKKDLAYNQDGSKIYIGFSQVKGVGERAAADIVKRGPYTSFDDFIDKHVKGALNEKGKAHGKSGVNKTAIEAMIYTNAFRDWDTRENLLETYWRSLLPKKRQDEDIEIPNKFDILKRERELLTIVLSERNIIDLPYGYTSLTNALDTGKDRISKIKGIVDKVSFHKSKTGNMYARLIINDLENSIIILVWKNFHAKLKTLNIGDIVKLNIKHLDGETFSLVKIEGVEND